MQRKEQKLVGAVVIAELDRSGELADQDVVEIAREEIDEVEAGEIGAEGDDLTVDPEGRPGGHPSRRPPRGEKCHGGRGRRADHQRPVAHAEIGRSGGDEEADDRRVDIVERQLPELQMPVHQGERQGREAAEQQRQRRGNRDRRHPLVAIKGGNGGGKGNDHKGAEKADEGADPEDLVELFLADLLALDDGLLQAEILEQPDEGDNRAHGSDETEILRRQQPGEHHD
ncbi:hypothetical protein SS05631_b53350 (plasmid) [Sinorhizobium sp. CCBAU 05631]|nr:hypothetical protein SS05631_b53350 [Sinorhizobium sp. CCBAU 05631]